jgi:hypothetical protein
MRKPEFLYPRTVAGVLTGVQGGAASGLWVFFEAFENGFAVHKSDTISWICCCT